MERLNPLNLGRVRPNPFAPDQAAVGAWFALMGVLADPRNPKGFTAKQVASRVGAGDQAFFSPILEQLVVAGDLTPTYPKGGSPRYSPQPITRCLAVRMASLRNQSEPAWQALYMAAALYADDPRAAQWRSLVEAFVALVATFTSWPSEICDELTVQAERWVAVATRVTPPSYMAPEDAVSKQSLELAGLKDAHTRLQGQLDAQVGALRSQLAELRAKVTTLTKTNRTLERENEALIELLEHLEDEHAACHPEPDRPELHAFLDGEGHGPLPTYVNAAEIARLRALVLDTQAPRKRQLAMAARLGEIYEKPEQFKKLRAGTSEAARLGFDSIRRAAIYKYRIAYGVSGRIPHVFKVGPRENFYRDLLDSV